MILVRLLININEIQLPSKITPPRTGYQTCSSYKKIWWGIINFAIDSVYLQNHARYIMLCQHCEHFVCGAVLVFVFGHHFPDPLYILIIINDHPAVFSYLPFYIDKLNLFFHSTRFAVFVLIPASKLYIPIVLVILIVNKCPFFNLWGKVSRTELKQPYLL